MVDENGHAPSWLKSFGRGFADFFVGCYNEVKSYVTNPIGYLINKWSNSMNWGCLGTVIGGYRSVYDFWRNLARGDWNAIAYDQGGRTAMTVVVLVSIGVAKSVATIHLGGRIRYTDHGYKQAMGRDGGRGISDSAIRNTIKNPTKITLQSEGRVRFEGKQGVVVLNKAGKVITAWEKSSKYWR